MMSPGKENVVLTLNGLIMLCKDGQEGFHAAGQSVRNTDLKRIFHSYEQLCRQLLAELQPEVRNLGGEPARGGTVSGSLHRGWMNLKQVLIEEDDDAVVLEAARSEEIAVKSYKEALKEDLPPEVRAIILRHYQEVKSAHDRINTLKKLPA